jgi:hypothetical protein
VWKEDNNQPKGQINGQVDKEYKKNGHYVSMNIMAR